MPLQRQQLPEPAARLERRDDEIAQSARAPAAAVPLPRAAGAASAPLRAPASPRPRADLERRRGTRPPSTAQLNIARSSARSRLPATGGRCRRNASIISRVTPSARHSPNCRPLTTVSTIGPRMVDRRAVRAVAVLLEHRGDRRVSPGTGVRASRPSCHATIARRASALASAKSMGSRPTSGATGVPEATLAHLAVDDFLAFAVVDVPGVRAFLPLRAPADLSDVAGLLCEPSVSVPFGVSRLSRILTILLRKWSSTARSSRA